MSRQLFSTSGPVIITQIRPVSRSEAFEMTLQMGRDYRKEPEFKKDEGISNLSATDLLEVSYYSETKTDVVGRFFVGFTYATPNLVQDFRVDDVVTIFYGKKGQAEFIYNHSNHFLCSCFNYRDARLSPEAGVIVNGQSRKKTQQIVDAINTLAPQGWFDECGPNKRIKRKELTYSYEKHRLFFDLRHLFTRKDITPWIIGSVVLLYFISLGLGRLFSGGQEFVKLSKSGRERPESCSSQIWMHSIILLCGAKPTNWMSITANGEIPNLSVWDGTDLIITVASSQKSGKRYSDCMPTTFPTKSGSTFGSYEMFKGNLNYLKKHLGNPSDTTFVIYLSPPVSKVKRSERNQIKNLVKLPYNANSDAIMKRILSGKKMSYEAAKNQR